MIGLKNSPLSFIQSEAKPKPIVTHSHMLSRGWRQLHEFDWFTVCVFAIGQSDNFGFGFSTLS